MQRGILIGHITQAHSAFTQALRPPTSIVAIECGAGATALKDALLRGLQQHDGSNDVKLEGFLDFVVETTEQLHLTSRRQIGAVGQALAYGFLAEASTNMSPTKRKAMIDRLERLARNGDIEAWFTVRETDAVKDGIARLRPATSETGMQRRQLPPHAQQDGRARRGTARVGS